MRRLAGLWAVVCVMPGCVGHYLFDREGGAPDAPSDGTFVDARMDVPTGDTVDASAESGIGCDAGSVITDGSCAPLSAPRQIAPLSTSTVTSRRPTFHWVLAPGSDGAHVQVCADRACTTIVTEFDATGTSGAPGSNLPVGVSFWRLQSRVGGVTSAVSSATWEFAVAASITTVDSSSGTFLDVNGDGVADLVVGANYVNGGTGAAYVYIGVSGGHLATNPTTTLAGQDGASGAFGGSVASAGDIDGDGFSDLVVGSRGANSGAGAAYVYSGSAAGLRSTPHPGLTAPLGGGFGSVVAGVGDVNGDGYGDVAVAAPAVDKVFVYLGSAMGLATSPAISLSGTSVAGAGDVNGDGFGDVLIGVTGGASLFQGNATMPLNTGLVSLSLGSTDDALVAGAGDVNGDGFADVVVASTTSNLAAVFYGSTGGVDPSLSTSLMGSGTSVAGAGDVNGDGYADIVFGNATNGTLSFYFGATSRVGTTAAPVMGPASGYFGWSVAGMGDVNGDGFADVAVGAEGGLARVFVYHGGAASYATLADTLVGPDGGSFGWSVATLDHVGVLRRVRYGVRRGCARYINRYRYTAFGPVTYTRPSTAIGAVQCCADGRASAPPD